MVFSSTIFLFLFLPLVLGSYLLVPARLRNIHLLVASLVFYVWGEPWAVSVLLVSIVANYGFGLLLARRRERRVLALGVVANLLLLGTFKYADFVVGNVNALFASVGLATFPLPHIRLPIGISFYTFQALSYLIDVYRGHVQAQRSLLAFALYKSLFPQLIAGPIVRYSQVEHEIVHRRVTWAGVTEGVQRFIVGLAKKMLIANTVAELADEVFGADVHLLEPGVAWLGLVAYTLQIYFDFSGYSDMAIGLGRILGFHFPENFAYPYVARSMREIWTRWHISLTTWFRDYVYVPLGGNRGSRPRVYFNLLSVFVLCGLWHGASWNYVVFGLYQGLFLILERQPWAERARARLWSPLQHVYAMGAWVLGLTIFRTETLQGAWLYLGALFGATARGGEFALLVRNDHWLALAAGVIAALPWIPWVRERLGSRDPLDFGPGVRGVLLHASSVACLLALLGLSALQLAGGTHNPFIYFRF